METALGVISARVTLPISVDPAVRTANSSESWATERMAKQDAAFEAYQALYTAGLVNENLLPAKQEVDDDLAGHNIPDHTPSLVQASPTLDPWPLISHVQQSNPYDYKRTLLTLRGIGEQPTRVLLLTPTTLPTVPDIVLHWNHATIFEVESLSLPGIVLNKEGK